MDDTGSAGRRTASIILAAAVVAAAWAVLQLHALGATRFHTHGESREGVVVQDLVHRGDWILPRRNGSELPRKPPLFYWLAAVAARVHGAVDEASVRFPSAALSGACAVLLAAATASFYGPLAGALGGIVLLTSFEWLRAATTARIDMTLTFGLTVSFIALLLFRTVERRSWRILFFAGAAWATLSKGIPGLAIPALAVVLLCLLADRSLSFVWRLRPIAGVAAVLVVCGAWYVAAAVQGGREFVSIVLRENVMRAVSSDAGGMGHRHSLAYLIVMLLLGLLPWTFLLPSVAVALWGERSRIDRWDPRFVALLWSGAVFAPYAVAASKRGVYLLPLFPAVAFLIGWWGAQLMRGRATAPWLARVLNPLAWVLAALLGVLAVAAAAQLLGFPLLDAAFSFLPTPLPLDLQPIVAAAAWPLVAAVTIAAVAAAMLASTAARGHWRIALPAAVVAFIAVVVGVRGHILPAMGAEQSRREFAQALRRAVVDPAAVRVTGGLDYGTLFYWGAPIAVYDPAGGTEPPRYLVLPELAWLRMPPTMRRHYQRMPGLTVEHRGDEGYVAVLQRSGGPDT